MDREAIQKRMELLLREKEKLILSYDGAVQDCAFWLQELDKKDNPTEVVTEGN